MTGIYKYDAFGAVRAQTGATTEWSYTGEQHDATGLEYLRARYYDAPTGRFLSQDPMPLLQRYAYANDNPANLVDPSGMSPESDRFHQLMAAEEQVQAWAKQILSDPCWKTHAFCAHVVGAWKRAAPYLKECAKGAIGGAVQGAIISGFTAGPEAALGGAAAGAGWGCFTGMDLRAATELLGASPANLGAQCTVSALGAVGTYFGAGGSASSGAVATGAGGCVGGGISWITRELQSLAGADVGAQAVGQCAATAPATLAFGLAARSDRVLVDTAGACFAGAVAERIFD